MNVFFLKIKSALVERHLVAVENCNGSTVSIRIRKELNWLGTTAVGLWRTPF